ncbi:hypothetical protein [Streptomyces albipurpureus]|uniref:DUF222 domain-containing protein n=1 Tax=Streptomyces albipurpureus TaxID=2897419 RepID=A0ABT0V0K0_9ACTN|nr:hypothetical protein [Streptomyces sp. CWNU-1]MCM2394372.1 hypothetical protein [Streptomyces sp. CWNU-1]
MFGLTTRRELHDEIDAHHTTIRALRTIEELVPAQRTGVPIEHPDELWSLIDWSLWASGMGDAFREQLADALFSAITPEQHQTALRLIQAWTDSGREPIGRRKYENLRARLSRAVRGADRWRKEAHRQTRSAHVLAEQLLQATSGHSAGARRTLGLPEDGPWERAVEGLNALVDADIPFHIEPDGHISNTSGDEHIEWDRKANRWRLVHDDEDLLAPTAGSVIHADTPVAASGLGSVVTAARG